MAIALAASGLLALAACDTAGTADSSDSLLVRGGGSGDSTAVHFNARLSGADSTYSGDPDGRGEARLASADSLCFGVRASHVDSLTSGAIHAGAAGESGPAVVTLFDAEHPAIGQTHGVSTSVRGCIAADAATVASIAAAPDSFYVSVASVAYPDGALRGQIRVRGPHEGGPHGGGPHGGPHGGGHPGGGHGPQGPGGPGHGPGH